MLTWNNLDILSYGAGTPSTTLALMSCQNAQRGPPYPYPLVPVYDAVIFCDLHSEPGWVYEQAAFAAAACRESDIPFYRLDADLYGDFTRNFGRARTACIPFWTLGDDGKKGHGTAFDHLRIRSKNASQFETHFFKSVKFEKNQKKVPKLPS